MCGVHLGPLRSINTSSVIGPYLQWFENAAARELFEFQESGSMVGEEYQKSLEVVLGNGVKVVLMASMNDQVVSDSIRPLPPFLSNLRVPPTHPLPTPRSAFHV
jgi:hypothetical protein